MIRLPIIHKGYTIGLARPTGGKAGRGRNKTTSLQIKVYRQGGYVILKQYRIKADITSEGLTKVVKKAKQHIDGIVNGEIRL